MGHNGGKVQINLWFPDPYYEFWSLNAIKMMQGWVGSGASDNLWPSLIGNDGLPTAMPNGVGASWVSKQLYIYGQDQDVWVLDWTGTATFSLSSTGWTAGSFSRTLNQANRQEFTLSGSPTSGGLGAALISLQISSMSGAISNIRLYRKEYESLINGSGATAMFDARFLNRVKKFGIIRFMDWCNCNLSLCLDPSYLGAITDCSWRENKLRGASFYGQATVSKNKYTVSALPALTHGLPVQFWMPSRPATLTVSSTTVGSPTQFSITGHGLSSGDLVCAVPFNDGAGSWTAAMSNVSSPTGLPPNFSVTVIDANTIMIPLNSTGFAAPIGTFLLMSQIQITDGTTTKRTIRSDMSNNTSSEFSTYASGGFITAVYDATFDVFLMSGNTNNFFTGVPPDVIIALANYCGAHPWVNFKLAASNSLWTAVAAKFSDPVTGIASGLTPYFEVDNEVWNTGFDQTFYVKSLAGKSFSSLSIDLGYAKRVAEISDALKTVLGSGSNWKMVLADQAVNDGNSHTNRFQGNVTINGGTSAGYPMNKADVFAYAPYINPIFVGIASPAPIPANYPGLLDAVDSFNQGNTGAAFDFCLVELSTPSTPAFTNGKTNQQLDGYVNVHTAGWASALVGYTGRNGNGVTLGHYEGGNGSSPSSFNSSGFPANATSGRSITFQNFQDMWLAFMASQQMHLFAGQYMRRMQKAGVVFPSQYALSGPWTKSSTIWGCYKTNGVSGFFASSTPWYDGILAANNGKRTMRIKT